MTSTLEHGEQVAFVDWFRATFPSILIYAIPNGGKRSITEAKRKALCPASLTCTFPRGNSA